MSASAPTGPNLSGRASVTGLEQEVEREAAIGFVALTRIVRVCRGFRGNVGLWRRLERAFAATGAQTDGRNQNGRQRGAKYDPTIVSPHGRTP